MSFQQLTYKTSKYYQQHYLNLIKESAHATYMKDHFGIHCKPEDPFQILLMYKTVQDDSCELINYINKKLEYGLDEKQTCDMSLRDRIQYYREQLREQQRNCSEQETINMCCPTSVIGAADW